MERITALLILMLYGLSACRQDAQSPAKDNSVIFPYVGTYVVGRIKSDRGWGEDPIGFRIAVHEDRLEWIRGTNTTISPVASAQVSGEAAITVIDTNGKTFVITKIQNGISIRDDIEGKTLVCHKGK